MKILNRFKSTSFLIHELLWLIDSQEQFQRFSKDASADDLYYLCRIDLGVSDKKFQEIYDRIYNLKLIELVDINGIRKLLLSESGRKSLFSGRFLDKHKSKIFNYTVTILLLASNLVLAAAVFIPHSNKKELDTLEKINNSINKVSESIEQSNFKIIHDTLYVHDTVKVKD